MVPDIFPGYNVAASSCWVEFYYVMDARDWGEGHYSAGVPQLEAYGANLLDDKLTWHVKQNDSPIDG